MHYEPIRADRLFVTGDVEVVVVPEASTSPANESASMQVTAVPDLWCPGQREPRVLYSGLGAK